MGRLKDSCRQELIIALLLVDRSNSNAAINPVNTNLLTSMFADLSDADSISFEPVSENGGLILFICFHE